MPKRSRKHIYRTGDRVVVVNPILVERVGYPLTWTMLESEFEEHLKLQEALRLFNLNPGNHKVHREFVTGLCKAAVYQRNFGGKDRTLHTVVQENLRGAELEVLSKRRVMTGLYYPSSGGYQSYSGEYDYQPGGLENAEVHILLNIGYGEIEDVNVEPVKIKAVEKIVA